MKGHFAAITLILFGCTALAVNLNLVEFDLARLARTCHRLAEIMDDREYALEIVDGVPPSTALRPSGEVVFLAEPDDAVARELLERTGRTPRRVAGWCGTAPILIVGPV